MGADYAYDPPVAVVVGGLGASVVDGGGVVVGGAGGGGCVVGATDDGLGCVVLDVAGAVVDVVVGVVVDVGGDGRVVGGGKPDGDCCRSISGPGSLLLPPLAPAGASAGAGFSEPGRPRGGDIPAASTTPSAPQTPAATIASAAITLLRAEVKIMSGSEIPTR